MKKSILFLSIAIIIGLTLNIIMRQGVVNSNEVSIQKEVEAIDDELLGNENAQQAENNILYKEQWGLFNTGESGMPRIDINLSQLPSIPKEDSSLVIGILDTGIDINHLDLKESIYINENEISNNGIDDDNNGYIDDVNGWDFINNDNTVFDYWGLDKHGTESAGIIKVVSEDTNIKIMPLKVMEGPNLANTDVLIKAIDYAKKMNVRIINCSWQAFKYDEKLETAMRESNILFICAAGNASCDVAYIPSYPACYKLANIISVASVDSSGMISTFSNYGSGIHIAAPGENVITTIPGDKYEMVNGTSIAAPFVTGVAAILGELFPSLSNLEISNRIKESVFRIDNLQEKVSTGGLIDVKGAIANDDKSLECPNITNMISDKDYVELFWSKVDNAASYEIEVNRSTIISADSTTYMYQRKEFENFHIFRVRAINGEKKSKWSIAKNVLGE